ncbi:tRNA (adenosine(37)-N6)-threonylcarbamoyltransferase complex dimerization subunit type 1 TsaB [Desulfuromonas carbonis]|uniref:tRNA (adenosine(37)-N6)-threonylcarbamoyltransferase complex dimerization subunit type 1 TsaB n=1 Tax=Desulfuromonas sp. DDH964 TaxID=1823759 RepID=UPI00078B7C5B|nr:tRNA (adenosine(37)-N6)-threonylcarbamoyltransferase complex dimerization subunit type 1 TsaB [Desulfuromonas sp. DDH964]AMV72540.1 nucleoid maintenance protease YeaZ [Desulfuromonas sp. DDH964]
MDPRLLLINTATPAGSIALTAGEQVLAELLLNLASPHSDRLLAGIDRLLADTGTSLSQLDAIGVVHGPGSFTGLRVGIATAKGLSLATGKPLVGISSLQALACQFPASSLPVCVLLDARKKEVYAGLYRWFEGVPQLQGVEAVIDPEGLLDDLAETTLFVGDGALVYRTLIVRRLGTRAHFVPWPGNLLRVSFAAPLVQQALAAGEGCSAAALKARYIRRSEAEIMHSRRTAAGVLDG